MQLPYFFEEELPLSEEFTLSESTSRHMVQVLRMKEGELIQLTNGNGYLLTAKIIFSHKKETRVHVTQRENIPGEEPGITIAVSFIKNAGRFEWFLEKATEIGISHIIPLICKRTEKSHLKEDRMKTIMVSAMLQSRQVWLPSLSYPVPIAQLVNTHQADQKFIAHCMEEKKQELQKAKDQKARSKIILIGPEGDFTPVEIEIAIENNFIPVSIGYTRLRTETAAMVAAVLLKY